MRQKTSLMMAFCMLFVFAFGFSAQADDAAVLDKLGKLESEMSKMQKTIDWQAGKIDELEKKEIKIAVPKSSDGGAAEKLPEWVEGLKFKADFRLRYEAQSEQDRSGTNDRNRFRYRLRFGFEKEFTPDMKVGFGLASGDANAITSTNTSFDGNFDLKEIAVNYAYATYKPGWAKVGPIKGLEVTGGKFKNPFGYGSSMMIWDSDVTPEGIYEKFDIGLLKHEDLDVGLTAIAGQLVLEEGGGTGNDDAELFAWQVGLNGKIKNVTEKPIDTKHVLSIYDFNEFEDPGNFASTSGNFTHNGGLSAEAFNIIEIYNEVAMHLKGLPKTAFYFDWAKNLGEEATAALGGGQDKAWAIGAKLGKAKKKGTWEVKYIYEWIEANAVPGVFTDSDFGQANRRGSIIKGAYALTDNLQLATAMFFTNNVNKGNPSVADEERKLFQLDLVWKF